MNRFTHALLAGGSGMLTGCSRNLLDISDKVTVIARNEARIRAIDPRVHPLVCDYTDKAAFAEALASLPELDLVVTWLHGKLPDRRQALANCLRAGGHFVQVLGSAHGDPARPDRLEAMRAAVAGLDVVYQAVVLGFVVEGGKSRWLTNPEISDGVFCAVKSGVPFSVLGTVSPWEARP